MKNIKKKVALGFLCLGLIGATLWTVSKTGADNVASEEEGQNAEKVVFNNQIELTINPEQIYGTFEAEHSWDIDPRVPENLISNGKTSVVQLKVLSVGEAEMLPKTENFYTEIPYTPINVEIIDTISGNPLSGKKTIYIEGGDIKISKLLSSMDTQRSSKMGLDELSQDQKDSMYISYKSEFDYKMKTGKEYGIILVNPIEDIYTVMANGYGIFDLDTTANTKSVKMASKMFKNVITGKESALKFSELKSN
ncbi:hypothetical protein CN378_03090 [Bacillus sp. AFS015802]|uniref:hypothetical protein n=1 Tax=Bacillus sp. AFS015802 TaxID=2033486 RepID=UPI000BF491D0|nr:hypothetical protein [Bacillus sp. AFS015802]PFA69767.1 hypothetical protein CN378_03090 [Bacillus sp. AFS015802]